LGVRVQKEIELWSDSFHEGNWACAQMGVVLEQTGGKHSVRYEHGFVPVHTFSADGWTAQVTVYGSYRAWADLPEVIDDLLRWGKPDVIAFDPIEENILFVVEETAATPTGNQALQRCERQLGAALAGIPFWYLLSEYGRHVDGGVRRDSIWPTVVAFKLTTEFRIPSLVLHYSDERNPEDYSSGTGVASLFQSLTRMLANHCQDMPTLHGLESSLQEQYQDMAEFLEGQWGNQIEHLPGADLLQDTNLHHEFAQLATGDTPDTHAYRNFIHWPTRAEWLASASKAPKSSALLKHDELSLRLESDIDERCYVWSGRTGSKPQKPEMVREWVNKQERMFEKNPVSPVARFDMSVEDFPLSPTGLLHVTTGRNICYLYDRWGDVLDAVEYCFPRLKGRLDRGEDAMPAIVYVSNSLKPGRLFGDPFTGQVAAYGVIFGKRDPKPRKLLAYFPHQVHSQALTRSGNRSNKGRVIMTEMTDLLLFHAGVAVDLKVGEAI